MKRITIVTLLILFVNIAPSLSQDFSIPRPGMLQGCVYSGDWTSPGYRNNSIKYVDDTTMCGYTYGRLCDIYGPGGTYTCGTGIYYYHIRQSNGKVYLRYGTSCSSSETLLYDFNLTVGDTAYLTFSSSISGKYIADTVRYITLVDNSFRKYIHLKKINSTGKTNLRWVEGIGDIDYGLLYTSDFEGGYNILICEKEMNNTLVYKNPSYNFNCDSLTFTYPASVFTSIYEDLVVSPNPVNTSLIIASKNLNFVSVTNFLGQEIYSYRNTKINSDKLQVDVSTFPSGIYFIKLKNENGSEGVKKIVKE